MTKHGTKRIVSLISYYLLNPQSKLACGRATGRLITLVQHLGSSSSGDLSSTLGYVIT